MKFIIRDLLWLVLVVGLVLAWFQDHKQMDSRVREVWVGLHALELQHRIDAHGGLRNVHSFTHIYSREYGTETELTFANDTPRQKWKIGKDAYLEESPYLTKYGWLGPTMIPNK